MWPHGRSSLLALGRRALGGADVGPRLVIWGGQGSVQPLHIAVVYSSITRGQIKGTVRVCANLLSIGGEPPPDL